MRNNETMNIILVDDEEIIHKTLGSFLSRSGHSVRKALNGLEALHLLEESVPDLIISDVKMPVMDGLELVEKFKVQVPATPIVLITGHGDEETAIAALQKGAYDYLRKPIKLEALFSLVERIEERKQLERSMMLERAKRNQSQRLLTMGTLAAGIAHEINNPTTMISGNLQILQQVLKQLEPHLRQVCTGHPRGNELLQLIDELPALTGAMLNGTERIAQIVQQVQTFARTQTKQAPETVDLCQCLEQALKQTEKARQGIPLEKHCRKATVEGVGQELTQVFANILLNAAQAVDQRPGGRISIDVSSHEAGWITVTVEDNGAGIADEIADRIFDPFFTTKDPGKGMGLGLALCQSIIGEHGGHIGFTSQPGRGCRFWVRLPHRQADEETAPERNMTVNCN